MPRSHEKSGPGQIHRQILEIDQKMQLLEHLKNGRTSAEIKALMGLSDTSLKSLRNEMLGEMTERYVEAVDSFRLIAFARYERLFEIADQRARGIVPDDVVAGERKDPLAAFGIPDKNWFDRALAVLAAEQNLLKYDLEQLAKRQLDQTKMVFNKISSLTLNSSDPMAKVAIAAMQAEWLESGESPDAALLQRFQAQNGGEDEGGKDQEALIFGDFPGEGEESESFSIESLEEQLQRMKARLDLAKESKSKAKKSS